MGIFGEREKEKCREKRAGKRMRIEGGEWGKIEGEKEREKRGKGKGDKDGARGAG